MTKKTESRAAGKGNGNDTPAPLGFDALANLNTEAFNSIDDATQGLFEGFEAYRQEALRFVGHRLQQDLAMPRNLIDCRTPQEAFSVYLDFMQTAQKDYFDQFGRLARIGSSIARSTAEDIEVDTATETAPAAEQA